MKKGATGQNLIWKEITVTSYRIGTLRPSDQFSVVSYCGSVCIIIQELVLESSNKKVPLNSSKAQFESKASIEDIMRLLVSWPDFVS